MPHGPPPRVCSRRSYRDCFNGALTMSRSRMGAEGAARGNIPSPLPTSARPCPLSGLVSDPFNRFKTSSGSNCAPVLFRSFMWLPANTNAYRYVLPGCQSPVPSAPLVFPLTGTPEPRQCERQGGRSCERVIGYSRLRRKKGTQGAVERHGAGQPPSRRRVGRHFPACDRPNTQTLSSTPCLKKDGPPEVYPPGARFLIMAR